MMARLNALLVVLCVSLPLSSQFSFPSQTRKPRTRTTDAQYKYDVRTIELPVDHFSFAVRDTFKLRYLVNDTWQRETDPPIFFYTGNEADIEVFAQNTGFVWEIAPLFNALVVFAEHRYYGQSMPYQNKSYTDQQHLGYLTSEQALADFVDLIEYLRSRPETKRSPVIAFGGSYGGMLSAWIRMKYPHIVQGAIAASAPILQFTDVTVCEAFPRIITSDFNAANDNCSRLIRQSWRAINDLSSNDEGRKWLSENWKLCHPLKNATDVKTLKSYLTDVYGNLAMVNYPYRADFLAPLPANPINAFCGYLSNGSLTGKDLLRALYRGVNLYNNYTGEAECLSIEDASPDLGTNGWYYQACTEMVMPICSDGVNDMFEPEPWNLQEYSEDCARKFNAKPQPRMACRQYGCTDLSTATNIVFSNGLMDPWSSGGVLQNLSHSAIAIIIPEGAHHLDLRSSNINDPYSVVQARKYHRFFIKKWIKEHRQREQRLVNSS